MQACMLCVKLIGIFLWITFLSRFLVVVTAPGSIFFWIVLFSSRNFVVLRAHYASAFPGDPRIRCVALQSFGLTHAI